ncbi:MAG: LysR family transcriptional regulator [Deltaproteobacteria bacterium]|nr:LysR family transcriptional regulator [Deltaproteobacteria bacterium]MBW2361545.1 LysR family transcriptional regulator [Deltaproteobacteria bacterium]
MNWDDIRYFLAVADTGSLNDAARELGVNYSTASRRLNAIEEEFGSRLFERLATGYKLTAVGAEMLESARRMEAQFVLLSRRVRGRDARLAGALRVATTDAVATILMPELAVFTRRYPEIEVDLLSTPAPTELAMREAEVALLATDRPPERLVGRRLARLSSALYASRGYLAERADIEDLAAQAWVGWEQEMQHIPAARWMRAHLPEARCVLRVRTGTALLAAVSAGVGLAHLLCFLADGDPSLQRLGPPEPALETGLWLLTHEDVRDTGRVRVFLDFVAEAIGRQRARLVANGGA